jgi:hypothetical protein
MYFRLRLAEMNATCRKQQVHNNFVGHTNDNISFEISLSQFGHGFVWEYLKRFANRRLVFWGRLDQKVNVLGTAHETCLDHGHAADDDILRFALVQFAAEAQQIIQGWRTGFPCRAIILIDHC